MRRKYINLLLKMLFGVKCRNEDSIQTVKCVRGILFALRKKIQESIKISG